MWCRHSSAESQAVHECANPDVNDKAAHFCGGYVWPQCVAFRSVMIIREAESVSV